MNEGLKEALIVGAVRTPLGKRYRGEFYPATSRINVGQGIAMVVEKAAR